MISALSLIIPKTAVFSLVQTQAAQNALNDTSPGEFGTLRFILTVLMVGGLVGSFFSQNSRLRVILSFAASVFSAAGLVFLYLDTRSVGGGGMAVFSMGLYIIVFLVSLVRGFSSRGDLKDQRELEQRGQELRDELDRQQEEDRKKYRQQ